MAEEKTQACIFCRIISGEIPCTRIFENESIVSFLDISPASLGHALIATKQHYETLLDIPEKELAELVSFTKRLARASSSALAFEGFNILMNNKKMAGQIVPHAHLHLIPRYKNDRISLNWSSRKEFAQKLSETAQKIKSFL